MTALLYLEHLCYSHAYGVAVLSVLYLAWFLWRHHGPRAVLGRPRMDCVAPRFRDSYRVGTGSVRGLTQQGGKIT